MTDPRCWDVLIVEVKTGKKKQQHDDLGENPQNAIMSTDDDILFWVGQAMIPN